MNTNNSGVKPLYQICFYPLKGFSYIFCTMYIVHTWVRVDGKKNLQDRLEIWVDGGDCPKTLSRVFCFYANCLWFQAVEFSDSVLFYVFIIEKQGFNGLLNSRANTRGGGRFTPLYPTLAKNQTEIPYPKPLKHSNKIKDWMKVRTIL